MNRVILIGNLCKDPDLQETPNGTAVCRFTIAVNRAYTSGGEKQTDFFNCTTWRGVAESVAKYCVKGSKIAVTGSVQIRNYDGNDGVKRNAVDIIVQDVEFLSPKKQEDIGVDVDGYNEACRNHEKNFARKPAKRQMDVFEDDGDIPF